MATKILIIFGPTASGKTKLACSLAQYLPIEVISADSMAIYRNMNIGTAKPTIEEKQKVAYHLIDICEPSESYNTAMFIEDASILIEKIYQLGKVPVIVGGTALYVKSLLEGIFDGPATNWEIRGELAKESLENLYHKLTLADPKTSQRISSHDSRRIIRALEVFYTTGKPISIWQKENTQPISLYDPCLIGIEWERSVLYKRIEQRVDMMLEQGLVEETKKLLEFPQPLSHTAMQAIGYRETIAALQNSSLFDSLAEQIKINTRHFAKRQLTWLRRFPIHWIPAQAETPWDEIVQQALRIWKEHHSFS